MQFDFYPTNLVEEKKRKIWQYFYLLSKWKIKAMYYWQIEKEMKISRYSIIKDLWKYTIEEKETQKKFVDITEKQKKECKALINFLKKNINNENAELYYYIVLFHNKTIKKFWD